MARSNFSFQKRQKELARKKKKEEKRKRKFQKTVETGEAGQDAPEVTTEVQTPADPD